MRKHVGMFEFYDPTDGGDGGQENGATSVHKIYIIFLRNYGSLYVIPDSTPFNLISTTNRREASGGEFNRRSFVLSVSIGYSVKGHRGGGIS